MLASVFFFWCAFREIRSSLTPAPGYALPVPVSPQYLSLVLGLALAFAWPPVHTRYFEWLLSAKATELAEGHRAKVHCNTLFDTMHDSEMLAAGHASPLTGKMVLQKPWCPQRAETELWSLGMFTHESMHVRGEINEAKTECQAVQRNYRAAKLLGVPDAAAKQNALDYFNHGYPQRGLTSTFLIPRGIPLGQPGPTGERWFRSRCPTSGDAGEFICCRSFRICDCGRIKRASVAVESAP